MLPYTLHPTTYTLYTLHITLGVTGETGAQQVHNRSTLYTNANTPPRARVNPNLDPCSYTLYPIPGYAAAIPMLPQAMLLLWLHVSSA